MSREHLDQKIPGTPRRSAGSDCPNYDFVPETSRNGRKIFRVVSLQVDKTGDEIQEVNKRIPPMKYDDFSRRITRSWKSVGYRTKDDDFVTFGNEDVI